MKTIPELQALYVRIIPWCRVGPHHIRILNTKAAGHAADTTELTAGCGLFLALDKLFVPPYGIIQEISER